MILAGRWRDGGHKAVPAAAPHEDHLPGAFPWVSTLEKQQLCFLEKTKILVKNLWDAFPESLCSPLLWGQLSGS